MSAIFNPSLTNKSINFKTMEKEIRQYNVEFKSAPDSKTIEGRAIPFNIASPNREGFRETILPSAVEGVIENSDIFMLYNHDRANGFLARSKRGKGSLKIDVREDGVYFSFKTGSDNLSTYVHERILNGDLDEMSWAFTVAEEKWDKGADGVYNRTITRFEKLYDFSVVDQSYYGIEGAVKCRSFEEFKAEEERLEQEQREAELERIAAEERAAEEAKAQEEAEKKAKLDEYYNKLAEEYQDILNKKVD